MNLESTDVRPIYTQILEKIRSRKAQVGVVGVGYVGRALVEVLVEAGFRTHGFDIDESKVLNIHHPLFVPTLQIDELSLCDIICICVPTPVDENRKPDLSFLIKAVSDVALLNGGSQLVIIESTVSPGTLRREVAPIFTKRGRRLGSNFYLAISPERVDPGNTKFNIKNTPKVVAGLDKVSTLLAEEFYKAFIDKVVTVATAEVAELSKMIENTFRLVNISLVNEIKNYADAAGINVWEAIDAAATKPFAFMAHYPGPGVGGHCIPVDPAYLLEEAKRAGVHLKTVEAALAVNEEQPKKIVEKARLSLPSHAKKTNPKMLLLGIAYKPGTQDTRESPALKIWKEAEKQGFHVSYFDPYVPKLNGYTCQTMSRDLLTEQDVIVIVTHHKSLPYELLTQINKPIIDTRNIMSKYYSEQLLESSGQS